MTGLCQQQALFCLLLRLFLLCFIESQDRDGDEQYESFRGDNEDGDIKIPDKH